MSPPFTIPDLTADLGAPADIVDFAHTPGTAIVFGVGALNRLSESCTALGATRILLVTDHGILKAAHAARALELLEEASFEVTIFADVHENPTTDDVEKCVHVARDARVDLIVGLGGGSSMDTAKGCNFILTNGGEMKDYWGVGKAEKEMLPLIAVPTTAGTGSECQCFALIADSETHMKMACGDKKAAARVAILDPELTLTQPGPVTVHTGIDALTHAIETAVTNKRTAASGGYSKLAFDLLHAGFERVITAPGDLEARARMQLGAAYAGTAIENSMLGAAHAAANPLTAHFGLVHGEAVGMMLPHVIRYNAEDAEVARIYAETYDGDLAARMGELLQFAEMPTRLSERGIAEDSIPMLAAEAAAQWTANFNPRPVGEADFAQFYRSAL